MKPRISICMPTLDSRRFLAERMESIRQQSLTDWELIVVDSHSTDGTYEQLAAWAQVDSRVKVYQADRDGIYPNINRCIQFSTADLVYIATSDDTMAPDCLEKLAAALQSHPTCGIAHGALRRIDETGGDENPTWWRTNSVFARSAGPLIGRLHVRQAPFDGLLHLLGDTVYISLTQLLVRRQLFEQIGWFESRWGPVGDFHWTMRATLQTDTVHVPDTWGGWRVYRDQATTRAQIGSVAHQRAVDEMIADALQQSAAHLSLWFPPQCIAEWSRAGQALRRFSRRLKRCAGPFARRAFVLGQLLTGSWPARAYVWATLLRRPALPQHGPDVIRRWLETAGAHPVRLPSGAAALEGSSCFGVRGNDEEGYAIRAFAGAPSALARHE